MRSEDFRAQGLGLRVEGLALRVEGLGPKRSKPLQIGRSLVHQQHSRSQLLSSPHLMDL